MNYEKLLRRMRQRIFDYPLHLEAKAERVLKRVKWRKMSLLHPFTGYSTDFPERSNYA